MTLSLLPDAVIEDIYADLLVSMSTELKNKLNDLLAYFWQQWFATASLSSWCVHGPDFRNNNNAEGEYFCKYFS